MASIPTGRRIGEAVFKATRICRQLLHHEIETITNPLDFVIVESPRGSEVAAMHFNPFKRIYRCGEDAGPIVF